MEHLSVFLYVLVIVVSLLLIGIILIQPSKSGGMGSAFGGLGESIFGGQVGSHLTKATVIMTSIFFIVTLILAAVIGRGLRSNVESEKLIDVLKNEQKIDVNVDDKKSEVLDSDIKKTEETVEKDIK